MKTLPPLRNNGLLWYNRTVMKVERELRGRTRVRS